jgi:putative hydrolase of the HAD superfamily
LKKYTHIFFDLDHTLWDFDTNSSQVITEILIENGLPEKNNFKLPDFLREYKKINEALWQEYHAGKIDRMTLRASRFYRTLLLFGVNDPDLGSTIEKTYLLRSPYKTGLLPNALKTLDYLKKKYELHIITNGFEEVQHIKLKSSGLKSYFGHVVTSDAAGYNKPQREIFEYALNLAQSSASNSLMVGDNIKIDIEGAMNAGIDQVFFNPGKQDKTCNATYQINDLEELMGIL